jgi:hypothetical protein
MVEEKLVPFKIFLACLCIVTFIWLSIWQTLKSGNHLENPFLNIVGYAFSIDWSSTPWQLLAVAGAFLSIVAVRLVDLNFQKFQTALETKDDVLVSNALSRLSCIERLCRLRTLLFLAYCTLVSFQAILVWNAHACWFIPYPFVDAVAQSFYHGYLPPSQCSN